MVAFKDNIGPSNEQDSILNRMIDQIKAANQKLQDLGLSHNESVIKVIFNCLESFSPHQIYEAIHDWIQYRKRRGGTDQAIADTPVDFDKMLKR